MVVYMDDQILNLYEIWVDHEIPKDVKIISGIGSELFKYTDVKFDYIICSNFTLEEIERCFTEKLFNKDTKVIFNFLQECAGVFAWYDNNVKPHVEKYNIPEENFNLLCSIGDVWKDFKDTKVNVYTDLRLNFYLDNHRTFDIFTHYTTIEGDKKLKSKKFITKNGRITTWRWVLLLNILHDNLLHDGYVSLLHRKLPNGLDDVENLRNDVELHEVSKEWYSYDNDFETNSETLLKSLPIEFDNALTFDHHNYADFPKHQLDCYVDFVTETTAYHLDYNTTEKTPKPFFCFNFPIIFAGPLIQPQYRELGFDFFDDIIDNSYDTIRDPKERFQKCYSEFKKLVTMDIEDLHKLWLDNYDRFVENNRIASEICCDEDDILDSIFNFCFST
tara:strand:+ start:1220 stop:2386 length:1167 start_codon:yes stop_codon:yes gene_type:complete